MLNCFQRIYGNSIKTGVTILGGSNNYFVLFNVFNDCVSSNYSIINLCIFVN